jgi:predicted amidophosphoribosyltransferase
VLDDLVTTAFPADCRVCGQPLLRLGTLPICDACRTAVPRQDAAICGCCGEALDMENVRIAPAEGLLCYPCRAVPPMFARAVAYAVYQDELREMIHLLKYERMRGVAKLLGGMLAEAILMLRAEAAPELAVVAVPLFPAKQRERGYNQSELLADAAINELRRSAPEWKLRRETGVLARQRDTRSQFELNPWRGGETWKGPLRRTRAGLCPAARCCWSTTFTPPARPLGSVRGCCGEGARARSGWQRWRGRRHRALRCGRRTEYAPRKHKGSADRGELGCGLEPEEREQCKGRRCESSE